MPRSSATPSGRRGPQFDQLIGSVDTLPGSLSVLHTGGKWYATSISVGQSAIPADLRTMVLHGTPASQFFSLGDTPQIVIGVPLPAEHAAYYEVFSLEELASTLRTLAIALAAAAVVTTLAGAALGRWASGRALRPLAGVTDAAVAIAGGQLDTRVEAGEDVDLQELASAFNRMTANLQERIEREARFTSDVSHELRSPLTTLSATVGVLEGHRDELSPRARSALELLDGDLKRFTRMVDDLLEISRFDAGSAELSLDEVDPGRAGAPGRGRLGPGRRGRPPDGRGLPRGGRARGGGPPAPGGQAALRAGHGQPGGERLALRRRRDPGGGGPVPGRTPTSRPAASGSSWRTRVPACPRPDRHHLFERFYRGSRAGRRESSDGTGLGLSLVAEHVRLHGGAIWIEDAPVRGSRFVIELPAASPATPSGGGRDRPTPSPRAAGYGRPPGRRGHGGLRHPDQRQPDGHQQEGRALPPAQPGQPHHGVDRPAGRGRARADLPGVRRHPDPGPVTRDVTIPTTLSATLTEALIQLLEGPTAAESNGGLQTFLRTKTKVSAKVSGGIATIDFSTNPIQVVGASQTLAIAQVVFTATQPQPG